MEKLKSIIYHLVPTGMTTLVSQIEQLVEQLAAKRPTSQQIDQIPIGKQSIVLDTFSEHDCIEGTPVHCLLQGFKVALSDDTWELDPRTLPDGVTVIDILNAQERSTAYRRDRCFYALRRLDDDSIQVHFVLNKDAWNYDIHAGVGSWDRYLRRTGQSI
jgi:hypothetical protein